MTDNTLYWQNFPASSNILNSNILSQSESQWQQDLTTFDFNSTPSPVRQPFREFSKQKAILYIHINVQENR
jgi:hypothetical protein